MEIDKKLKGAWLIHHTNKLQSVTNQSGFDNTYLSGKSGILLSAISSNYELKISQRRLETLAKASNINLLELPTLIDVLQKRGLIDIVGDQYVALGVTTHSTLQHTCDIFDSREPTSQENAAIYLAEKASLQPIMSSETLEEISDTYKLDNAEAEQLINDSVELGFVDFEQIGKNDKILFNGNLFRRGTTAKTKNVIDSLSTDEQSKLIEVTENLRKNSCISTQEVKIILGELLFNKVTSIGLFDVNVVSNSRESVGYVTLPSAFSKFSNGSMIDDAFDLAKAFVSSITYGMTKSSDVRGKITMVEALLKTLIRGESIGPVAAIAEDYRILELKGVVKVSQGTKNGRTGPMMTLLKKEVGELALQSIKQGDVSEHSLIALPSAAVTKFVGPEPNREKIRKKQTEISSKATIDMLSVLRQGGAF